MAGKHISGRKRCVLRLNSGPQSSHQRQTINHPFSRDEVTFPTRSSSAAGISLGAFSGRRTCSVASCSRLTWEKHRPGCSPPSVPANLKFPLTFADVGFDFIGPRSTCLTQSKAHKGKCSKRTAGRTVFMVFSCFVAAAAAVKAAEGAAP